VTTVKKRLQYARKHLRGEYLRDEQFRRELGNDPLVTWLIGGVDDPYQSDLVEQGDGELPISIQDILVEETIPIIFAGHGAGEAVPPYGQIAWHPVR
jgi:hypothetical protein